MDRQSASVIRKICITLVSLSYNPLPVTNNIIYDLYDLYWEIYNNEDYDIYDAEWNTTDIFGCACGIGACVNEERTNITAPNGQITCQCAPGSYMNFLQVEFQISAFHLFSDWTRRASNEYF